MHPNMKLVLLLLPVCALALLSVEEIQRKSKEAHVKISKQRKFGVISIENKEKLAEAFGEDPDMRRARLSRLSKRKLSRSLSTARKDEIEESLKKITPVRLEKPNEDATADLFEVNQKEGVAPYLFQGDLHLTDEQLLAVEQSVSGPASRGKRQAATGFSKWTDNTVYYYFDSSINDRKKASVAAAIKFLEANTCVRFVESETQKNRVKVFSGVGCYSAIGMIGGVQNLSLGDGCEVMGTSAHEFTHALGVWHTQMRSDRDDHVTIDLSDVPEDAHGNFVKMNPSENYLYTPYEYGGFMHYGANAFVQHPGKLSIIPKDARYAYTMGNRLISFYDLKMINDHYECTEICPASTSAQCKNGGTPNPKNCNVCICPHGYGGALCDKRPEGCGEELTATATWQSKTFNYGNMTDNKNIRDIYYLCNYWITAPKDQKIQVKITSMWNTQCQFGCAFNGMEIKVDKNPKVTNPIYCCPEFNNIELTSELNPTPLVAFNRYFYTTFTIEYRYIPASGVAPVPAVTTTTSAPSKNCFNTNSDTACADNALAGFCSMMPQYSFQTIKFNCGKACGLCGKAASPCVDTHPQCADIKAAGMCESMNTMEAEYHCAKTCGFCERPN